MNQKKLTQLEKLALWRMICHGRGTPASMARALGIDRRTAQRLTDPDNLPDLIPPAREVLLCDWYALIDTDYHTWSGEDGVLHFEARTAVEVRDDLLDLAEERIGADMKRRMVEEYPKVLLANRDGQNALAELRRLLTLGGFSIPDRVRRFYRHDNSHPLTDPNGNPL